MFWMLMYSMYFQHFPPSCYASVMYMKEDTHLVSSLTTYIVIVNL